LSNDAHTRAKRRSNDGQTLVKQWSNEQDLFRARARVVGERGTMEVENFIVPFVYHAVEVG
jgi:hypothetical protein